MGLGHRRSALLEYGLMVAAAGVALFARALSVEGQLLALVLVGLAYLALAAWLDHAWAQHRQRTEAT